MPEQRVLGFDYGTKRIGVACGQTITHTATALTQLACAQGLPEIAAVKKLIVDWQPTQFVVGLPLNMDGTTNKIAKAAKKFAKWLTAEFQIPVDLVDERLSSREAQQRLQEANPNKKYTKEQLNSVAAQVIVEQWLNNHSI